ncbi:MAG: hypothetical protein ACYDEX_17730, partial [Mobilitalea sp.]
LNAAETIWNHANLAMEGVRKIKKEGINLELQYTLDDIEALSYLGYYYAIKLQAAVSLCMYRLNGNKALQEEAATLLRTASSLWARYSFKSKEMYIPQVLSRLCGYVDVQRFDRVAEQDVLLALNE